MPWLDFLPVWLSFPLGFVLLILGAELLVRGAARIAAGMGITPLVIGLTVVAFGTSAPELAVSVGASLTGEMDVAVGNIVGSNIMNVLLILGASALITPLVVSSQLVRIDVPLMILASVAVWLMAADGMVSRTEGIILAAALLAYVGLLYVLGRRETARSEPPPDPVLADAVRAAEPGRPFNSFLLVIVGLLGLAVGARWLVGGATILARWMEISELVIGLTVVAVGTSLPEIATSILASLRGQRDIAVGNIVGSNIFNLLCVLGLTAALPPAGVPVAPAAIYFDLPVMTAVALACLPIFFTGGCISRWEGGLLVAYFVAYTGFLLLQATQHDLLGPFSLAMMLFAIPLTAAGLLASLLASIHRHRRVAAASP